MEEKPVLVDNYKQYRTKLLLDLQQFGTSYRTEEEVFRTQFEALVMQQISKPNFSFTSVLEEFSMSRSTFQRTVKEYYGCSPLAYLKEQRLILACKLLKRRKGTVREVSYAVGFNSISYFNRAFKAQFGQNPSSLIG